MVGNMVEKDGVTWLAEIGRVCLQCSKAHRQCLWRGEGGKRAKACLHCFETKKGCKLSTESESEQPRKKKATVQKVKVDTDPVASGSGPELADVLKKILVELQVMRQDMRTGFRKLHMEVKESRRTVRGILRDVVALKGRFVDEEEESEKVLEGADETQN